MTSPTLTRPDAPDAVEIPHACEPTADVSAMTVDPVPPGAATRRLVGIDVARGLALVGMMVVHILPSTGPDDTMSVPWVLTVGKAAALFAVLAGVGIAFGSGGRRRPVGRLLDASAASLVVRALLVAAVGLLLGYVVPADSASVILAYYGALFVLAVPLLSLSTRALVVLASVITLLVPVLSHVLRAQLEAAPATNPTFAELLGDPLGLATTLALTGAYPALPWLAYLCVGLAVGRAMITSRGVATTIGALGIALALAASAGSWLVMTVAGGWSRLEAVAVRTMSPTEYTDLVVWGPTGTLPTTSPWWLGTMSPHSSTPFDMAFTIGTSLAVLGAAVLLGRVAGRVLAPLAAAGSMTLTLYALHLLMLVSPVQPESDAVAFALQLVVVIVFAVVWNRCFTRGPLEAAVWRGSMLVRSLILGATKATAPTSPSVDAPGATEPSDGRG